MGQMVDVITNGQMTSGTYNLTWDGTNAASGVYLIQTEIGSEINVQNAEQDLKEAKLAISKFSENEKNPEKIKALKEVSKAEAKIQAAKN